MNDNHRGTSRAIQPLIAAGFLIAAGPGFAEAPRVAPGAGDATATQVTAQTPAFPEKASATSKSVPSRPPAVTKRTARRSAQERDVLLHEIESRDETIRALQKRVDDIENALSRGAATHEPTALPPTPPPPAKAADAPKPRASSRLEVDPEAATRALERALVQSGARLLPPGKIEVEPSATFTHQERRVPIFYPLPDTTTALASDLERSKLLDLSLGLRLGLPMDAQIEVEIPYRMVESTSVTSVGGAPVNARDADASGAGDIRVAIAKTLLRESSGSPDLVARLIWDTDSGDANDNGVSLSGFGFDEYTLGLSATKRFDPLVVTGSLSYTDAQSAGVIEPGDSVAVSLGAYLATSPETTLSAALNQSFFTETKIAGNSRAGTDNVVSNLTLGAALNLGRQRFLQFSTGFGLTEVSPDYFFRASIGNRLSIF